MTCIADSGTSTSPWSRSVLHTSLGSFTLHSARTFEIFVFTTHFRNNSVYVSEGLFRVDTLVELEMNEIRSSGVATRDSKYACNRLCHS